MLESHFHLMIFHDIKLSNLNIVVYYDISNLVKTLKHICLTYILYHKIHLGGGGGGNVKDEHVNLNFSER